MKQKNNGVILVLLSTIGFGSMGVLAGGIYQEGYGVLSTLSSRFFIAFLFLGLYMKYKGLPFYISKIQMKYLLFLGLICYTTFSLCYFTSIKYTGAALAALIFASNPVYVCLFSRLFLKKYIGLYKSLFLLLSLLALFFLTGTSDITIDYRGVALALLGSIVYAIYTMLLENKTVRSIPPVTSTFYIIFFTTLSLLSISFFLGELEVPYNLSITFRLILLGIFSTSMAILTFYLGVQKLGAIKASIISNFEAFIATVLAMIFLGERLTLFQLVGAVLMIVSVFGITLTPDVQKQGKVK